MKKSRLKRWSATADLFHTLRKQKASLDKIPERVKFISLVLENEIPSELKNNSVFGSDLLISQELSQHLSYFMTFRRRE